MGRHAVVISLAAAILGVALAGCSGGESGVAAFTPTPGSDGAYCKTYRSWKVYELDHGEAFDQPSAGALRRYWRAYLRSEKAMNAQAPPEIRSAVALKVRFVERRLTPLLERYGFDLERVRRDATPTEQALLFQGPPSIVQDAQAAQYAFEDRACGTQPSPPAARVVFEIDASSRPYCTALSALNRELDRIALSRFTPRVTRAVVSGPHFQHALDRLEEAAPEEIAADVSAESEWFRTRWHDVVARYDFDLRKIYLYATPEDLAVFNRTHPHVLEHSSRTTAYEQQACEVR